MEKFFSAIFNNMPTFFKVWGVVLLANQVLIFGACFAPYCLIAALPHTSIISAVITYFILSSKKDELECLNKSQLDNCFKTDIKETKNSSSDTNSTVEPLCPKCSSKMVERTARKGRYIGNKFWGCSKFPKCNGIINKQTQ